MRTKKSGRDLPPRMLRRKKQMKSGKVWIGYYYNGRDENGKRREVPLGNDLNEAKRKWAALESTAAPVETGLMKYIFDRYIVEILPKKAISTQKDYSDSIKNLRIAFNDAPISHIESSHIARYRDARKAPVRANREISLLSSIINRAKEWGYLNRPNPCTGVSKNKEKPRTFYADRYVWDAVYQCACLELRDAMDLALLSAQRPGDVRKMKTSDIIDGTVEVRQGKSNGEKYLRILLDSASGKKYDFGNLIDRLRLQSTQKNSFTLLSTPKGAPLSDSMLRRRFNRARSEAAAQANMIGNLNLAEKIKEFQFRDIRAKSASEIKDILEASRLMGHSLEDITKRVYRRVGEIVKPTR